MAGTSSGANWAGPRKVFAGVLRHHYAAEDTAEIDHILGRQYDVVVGNPPYITPKDPAMRDAYREIYLSCHRKYGLGAPFVERFFDLARAGVGADGSGFVGLIVANTFMKREFGAKLIEVVFPRVDLTHVIDTSSAYIPGHTTPTVVLFGRNRSPVSSLVRTVRVTTGAPEIPLIPSEGPVWQAILAQTDVVGSSGQFISVEDTPRQILARHPWSLGGGGAGDVQAAIERQSELLAARIKEIGFGCIISEEAAFIVEGRHDVPVAALPTREIVFGEQVREWRLQPAGIIIFPYDESIQLSINDVVKNALWQFRTLLLGRRDFGNRSYADIGRSFAEYHQIPAERNRSPLAITFGEIATHNHFVLDRGGKVFNQTAPIIKLPNGSTEEDHLGLVGLLNSSTACFWFKQVTMNKGGGGIGGGLKTEYWDRGFVFNATKIERFPITESWPSDLASIIDNEARRFSDNLPSAIVRVRFRRATCWILLGWLLALRATQ